MNYSTCVGGGLVEEGLGIAVDSTGNAYVAGYTTSISSGPFPTTPDALQKTTNHACQVCIPASSSSWIPAEPVQLSWCTPPIWVAHSAALPVGVGTTYATAVAVDSSNIAYVAGWTAASADKFAGTGFPTANAIQASLNGSQDAYFYKLDPSRHRVKRPALRQLLRRQRHQYKHRQFCRQGHRHRRRYWRQYLYHRCNYLQRLPNPERDPIRLRRRWKHPGRCLCRQVQPRGNRQI